MAWKEEYWKSIKNIDTEEKLDLYFYRLVGFVIAKISLKLRLTPTNLTLLGLALGLCSGYFFYHNESTTSLLLASGLLISAGIFDSADGQLARMGGKSTKLGIVLDGLCDNLVFASAYIGSALTVAGDYGPALWGIVVFAGICHSCQSSVLDFYNREYLCFGCGLDTYWNPTLQEALVDRREATLLKDKIFWRLRSSWIWQQNKLTTRTDGERAILRALAQGPRAQEAREEYREHNRLILRFWRLMGPNFHTIMILVCVFLRRFDLYLIGVDIISLSLALFMLRFIQWRQDQKLFRSLKRKSLL